MTRRADWRSDRVWQAGFLIGSALGAAVTVAGRQAERSARRGLVDWPAVERQAIGRLRGAPGALPPSELRAVEPAYAAAMERIVPRLSQALGAELPGVVERVGVTDRAGWVRANISSFAAILGRRARLLLAAKPARRFDRLPERVRNTFVYAFGQKKFLTGEQPAGLMHFVIFWGFVILGLQVITQFGRAFSADWFIPGFGPAGPPDRGRRARGPRRPDRGRPHLARRCPIALRPRPRGQFGGDSRSQNLGPFLRRPPDRPRARSRRAARRAPHGGDCVVAGRSPARPPSHDALFWSV